MSKVEPRYAEEVPYVPMNFTDRNNLVGQVMPIIEASIPDKKQQEAVKNLIKRVISDYFHSEFSLQFSQVTQDNVGGHKLEYSRAIWNLASSKPRCKNGCNGIDTHCSDCPK